MEIREEMLQAIVGELALFRVAERTSPSLAVGLVRDCACVGPMPECRCAKRERLVREFLDSMKEKGGSSDTRSEEA